MVSPQQQYPIVVLLCTGMLLAVLALGCTDNKRQDESRTENAAITDKYGGVYRKALENEPVTLDPALVTDTHATSIVQQLFDGLVQFDADLNVIPSIARAWSASHDGLVWIFHLRQGVKFHHGREVTADDFVYSFTRVLDPQL